MNWKQSNAVGRVNSKLKRLYSKSEFEALPFLHKRDLVSVLLQEEQSFRKWQEARWDLARFHKLQTDPTYAYKQFISTFGMWTLLKQIFKLGN